MGTAETFLAYSPSPVARVGSRSKELAQTPIRVNSLSTTEPGVDVVLEAGVDFGGRQCTSIVSNNLSLNTCQCYIYTVLKLTFDVIVNVQAYIHNMYIVIAKCILSSFSA